MQGLLDQYTLTGNPKGLKMVVWMTDYFSERVKNLILKYSIQRHWEAMNEETGGLNDVMYQLYTITVMSLPLQIVVFSNLGFRLWYIHGILRVVSKLFAERPEAPNNGPSFRQTMLPRTTQSSCQNFGFNSF
jgi:hypothetical protein